MDSISAITFDLVPAAMKTGGVDAAAGPAKPATFDVAQFHALYAASAVQTPAAAPGAKVSGSEETGLRSVLQTLQNLNGNADSLGSKALELQMNQGPAQPGDMLMMAMKAQEFLFHCELTSNVANRTSDGVQQLFREQS